MYIVVHLGNLPACMYIILKCSYKRADPAIFQRGDYTQYYCV